MSPAFQSMLMDSATMFVQLFVELTLLFLIISFLVGLINQKLPAEKIQRLLGAHKGRGYLTAAALGAVTPFCSCSTIPMLIGLLKARAGFGPTMTFLFTSPLLNPIVIALFIPVLGLNITLWYAALALGTSIAAGVLLQHFGFERYVRSEVLNPNCNESTSGCGTAETTSCCAGTEIAQPSIWRKAWGESWSLYCFVSLVIVFVTGLLGAIAISRGWTMVGLWQRLSVGVFLLWKVVLATALLVRTR